MSSQRSISQFLMAPQWTPAISPPVNINDSNKYHDHHHINIINIIIIIITNKKKKKKKKKKRK